MNVFNFGVGTDLYRAIKEIKKDEYHYFIDDSLGMHEVLNDNENYKVFNVTMQDFIIDTLLYRKDRSIFNRSFIKSDRMIEHIDLGTLSSLIIPLFRNLHIHCKATIQLVYPDAERVLKFLSKKPYKTTNHELANIELLAFGDHKVVLTSDIVRELFSLGDNAIRFSNIDIDNKPFYKRVTIESDTSEILDLNYGEETKPFADQTFDYTYQNIQDRIWELSNKMDLDNDTRSIFSLPFYDIDKINSMPAQISKYINTCKSSLLTLEQVLEVATMENYFKAQPNIIFNKIHPYKSAIILSK